MQQLKAQIVTFTLRSASGLYKSNALALVLEACTSELAPILKASQGGEGSKKGVLLLTGNFPVVLVLG
ncbi:MAG: hypothetical protein PHV03_07195 [Desulfitobacteriaceae bacterium]|nr:hypothetical protein [Desulfitobacteriaceae bacterium]